VEVVRLAVVVPPLVLRVPWPMLVVPSRKVTTPVGLPGPVIVAVKVALCPKADGFTEDATTVVVLALLTVWVRAPELAWKLLSPP
jgi:hypothetical protein